MQDSESETRCFPESSLTRGCRTFSYGFISYMDDKIRVPILKAEKALRHCEIFQTVRSLALNRARLALLTGDEDQLDRSLGLHFSEDRR